MNYKTLKKSVWGHILSFKQKIPKYFLIQIFVGTVLLTTWRTSSYDSPNFIPSATVQYIIDIESSDAMIQEKLANIDFFLNRGVFQTEAVHFRFLITYRTPIIEGMFPLLPNIEVKRIQNADSMVELHLENVNNTQSEYVFFLNHSNKALLTFIMKI